MADLDKSPIMPIDLALGAKLIGADEKEAEQMVAEFIDALYPEKKALEKAFNATDWPSIKKIAHKVHGASCYCGVPRMKSVTKQLEDNLATGENELSAALYHQFLEEIKLLEAAYAALKKN